MAAPGKRQIDWEEVRRQSSELGRKSEMNTRVANVPKYTAVKEGQQYPMGKRGQYKLFHEHVWPKGFTPQRRDEVAAALQGNVEMDPSLSDKQQDRYSQMYAHVYDSLARSTIPAEDIKTYSDNANIIIDPQIPGVGEFDSDLSEVRVNPKTLRSNDPSGVVASQSVVHELGHLHDFLSDEEKFFKNDRSRGPYKQGNDFAYPSPALEGRAEGFRLAHTRITRGMKRKNKILGKPLAGYEDKNFKDQVDRSNFLNNRLKTFREQSGLPSLPVKETSKKAQKSSEQLRLPGID